MSSQTQIHKFSKKFNLAECLPDYGILCQRIFNLSTASPTHPFAPYGMTYCVIEAGGHTRSHKHFEKESFLILKGRGVMDVNGQKEEVGPGNLIFLPAFSEHTLTNLESTNLEFVSIYWEPENPQERKPKPKGILVTSAPPTPNGPLHLGHLSGPYLAADVYQKYLQLQKINTVYASGTDENQNYVVFKALQLNADSVATAERFATSIINTLTKFEAKPDFFLRPLKDSAYSKFVQGFFSKLVKENRLQLKNVEAPYCHPCNLYLSEAFVGGLCPHCQAGTSGGGCESCGLYNDGRDLKDAFCKKCKNPSQLREIQKYYFPLENYRDILEQHYATATLPNSIRPLLQRLLSKPLPEISATYPSNWGIASELKNQTINVWLEMAASYLWIAQKTDGAYLKDSDYKTVQCFGFDNSFYYLAFIPALLKAFDSETVLPQAYLINEFYLLDGKKFSTSRQHAIWGDEALERLPADIVRLYLSLTRSETKSTNFTLEEMMNFLDSEKIKAIEWILKEASNQDGFSPFAFSQKQELYCKTLQNFVNQAALYLEPDSFSLRLYSRNFLSMAETIFEFAQSDKSLLIPSVKYLLMIAYPLMPALTRKLMQDTQWISPLTFNEKIPSFELEPKDFIFSQSLTALKQWTSNEPSKV